MLLKDHKDLKNAIVAIPDKEKDKLLLRLIAKDKVLTEHLHFKLLEDEADLEDRAAALLSEIDVSVKALHNEKKASSRDSLLLLRKLNGRVNHHFKVTKDLNSEIELRLAVCLKTPLLYEKNVFSPLGKFNDRLSAYFVRTTFALYKKYLKIHPDLQFDLQPQFNELLSKLQQYQLSGAAADIGLPEEV